MRQRALFEPKMNGLKFFGTLFGTSIIVQSHVHKGGKGF